MTSVYNHTPKITDTGWLPQTQISQGTSATILWFTSVSGSEPIEKIDGVKIRTKVPDDDRASLGDLWVVDSGSTVNQPPNRMVKYKGKTFGQAHIGIELVSGTGSTLTSRVTGFETTYTPLASGGVSVKTTSSDQSCQCPRSISVTVSHPELLKIQPHDSFDVMPFRPASEQNLVNASDPTKTEKGFTLVDPTTGASRRPVINGVFQAWVLDNLVINLEIPDSLTPAVISSKYRLSLGGSNYTIDHDTLRLGRTGSSESSLVMTRGSVYDFLSSKYHGTDVASDANIFPIDLGPTVAGTTGSYTASITIVDASNGSPSTSRNLRLRLNLPKVVFSEIDEFGAEVNKTVILEDGWINVDIPVDVGQADCCAESVTTEVVDTKDQGPRRPEVLVSHPELMKIEGLDGFLDMPLRPENVGSSSTSSGHSRPTVTPYGSTIRDENGVSRRPIPIVISQKNMFSNTWQLSDLKVKIDVPDNGRRDMANHLTAPSSAMIISSDVMTFIESIDFKNFSFTTTDTVKGPGFTAGTLITEIGQAPRYSDFSLVLGGTISVPDFQGARNDIYSGIGFMDSGETPEKRSIEITIDLGDVILQDLRSGQDIVASQTIISGAWVKISIPLDIGQTDYSPTPPNTGSIIGSTTRSTNRTSIMSCSGSVSYVDGVIMSNRDFDNAEDLIREVGSDRADPTADEYEGSISGGNNSRGVTGLQDPKPTQTTPPGSIDVTPSESQTKTPPDKPTPTSSDAKWDGSNYDVRVGKNFILRNFTIGYPDKSKNQILGCLFPNQLTDVGSMTKEVRFQNLVALAENVLDPLYAKFGPLRINSGIRNQNSVSSGISQHVTGEAVDVQFPGWTYDQYWSAAQWIRDNLPFDQFIFEHSDKTKLAWFHLSFRRSGNRPSTDRTKVMTMLYNKYDPGLKRYF